MKGGTRRTGIPGPDPLPGPGPARGARASLSPPLGSILPREAGAGRRAHLAEVGGGDALLHEVIDGPGPDDARELLLPRRGELLPRLLRDLRHCRPLPACRDDFVF